MLVYKLPYAYDGLLFEAHGQLIEVYKYNLNNLNSEAKKIVKEAKEGLVYLEDENVEVTYNNGLIISNNHET